MQHELSTVSSSSPSSDSPSKSSSFEDYPPFESRTDDSLESDPLATTDTIDGDNAHSPGKGSLTFTNGIALVLGLQIGSGIFFAPSQVSNHVPSPGMAVVVWLLAGTLVWTGAASFIELGLAIPKNGGVQEYLRNCYSEFFGFLFSWVWIAIGKPCGIALTAMIFAENLSAAVMLENAISSWTMRSIAIAGLFVITGINCSGKVAGAKAANIFLLFKLMAISSIITIGIVASVARSRRDDQQPHNGWFGKDPDLTRQTMPMWTKVGEYITAIYGALFCYGGWETVSLIWSGTTHLPTLLTHSRTSR